MTSSNDVLFTVIAILFLAMWVPLFLIQWAKRPLADSYETERELGQVGNARVAIAFDGRRRWVELIFDEESNDSPIYVHAYFTPSEALLVSQWLRTAAMPGRTLADARRRRERTSP